ncbi:site-specific integrase [Dechloromonas sp. XY25]|uniref:Site-specific integrase n=1 Tax=Dechloromonas hankyongensis TaxID=2908002 RepID=A0ABS9K6G4_9RHOO|nr:phage integrase family protein [Dechloromonas hankyongensis]MCG2578710.1 site-specific integrase [Dechloromonas hankyongensis]
MAQHNEVLLHARHFTRVDFTALRAWLNRLPLHQISALYYHEDDLQVLDCNSDGKLQNRLEELRDRLIERAIDNNAHVAELLRNARRSHAWSGKLVNFLVQAADTQFSKPERNDPVSAWFRPAIARLLRAEGARSLGDLMALIATRGNGWWKPIPRIGAGKAARIVAWLQSQASEIGELTLGADIQPDPASCVVLRPGQTDLAPIERILLPYELDGHEGRNRHSGLCLISARHDRDAIDAYLYKFRAQEKTRRAYQKEIERFLLWCITVRSTPMSAVLQDDCEAYKDFIASIPPNWVGLKRKRHDHGWRPFAGPLSPASQRYAIQAIRLFFNWLVNVRYLGGNPWMTVADPRVATAIHPIQIDKALPEALWSKLIAGGGLIDQLCTTPDEVLRQRYRLRGATAQLSMSAQFRLVRAALLLIGDTGIRREEAAYATRDKLKSLPDTPDLWELDVLGKRNKWRTVFPTKRAVDALRAHWADRGSDFSYGLSELPLLSPLMAPPTQSAQAKHLDEQQQLLERGFSVDGLYQVIKTALRRIATDETFPLDEWERGQLHRAAPHAFRHTFGTHAVASDVPLDVVQKVLGHASLQTTTIYVQAEKKRSIAELGKFLRNT